MTYLKRTLTSNEELIETAYLHWMYTLEAFLWLIFGWWLLGYGIYKCISILIRKATTEIAITSQRFIFKTGWLNQHTTEFDLSRIEGVNFTQSFLGRLFGFGTLEVRGTGVGDVVLPYISRPMQFRSAIVFAKAQHEEAMSGAVR